MRRTLYGIAALVLLGIVLWHAAAQFEQAKSPETAQLITREPPVDCQASLGLPSARRDRLSAKAEGPSDSKIIEAADRFLEENGILSTIAEHHHLNRMVMRTPLRRSVVYSVTERGLPVVGLNIWVDMDRAGNLVRIQNEYRNLPPSDLSRVDEVSAFDVSSRLNVRYQTKDAAEDSPPILFVTPNAPRAELAFVLHVQDTLRGGPAPVEAVFRASDGQILGRNLPRAEF